MEKKTLCLYFEVHQPIRLRKYHFFDIGKRHDYYDDFANRNVVQQVARDCYLPANRILLNLIREFGMAFKISFSITGSAIEQFERYAPEVLESFKELADTGCVEFLAETYSHSLASVADEKEFKYQVEKHAAMIKSYFGQKPVSFRNTEFIYSDQIGSMVAKMGYTTMLTEGAKHVLGWKSPDYIYTNAINPKLKLLLRNASLSDDISLRFSNTSWDQWPLTAEKYTHWLQESIQDHDIINLFMNYDVLGVRNTMDSGIFDFLSSLPKNILATDKFEFLTPSEATKKHQPVAPLHVPFPISWTDEERDITGWLGNEMQEEAFEELYNIRDKVSRLEDPALNWDFACLQDSDNLYYMCTKLFSCGTMHGPVTPYTSPYEAFINYMNTLSDFIDRVDREMEKKNEVVTDVKKETVAKNKKTESKKKVVTNTKKSIKAENKTKMPPSSGKK